MKFREIQEMLERNRLGAGPLPPASLGMGKESDKDFSKSLIKGIRPPAPPTQQSVGDGVPIPPNTPENLLWLFDQNSTNLLDNWDQYQGDMADSIAETFTRFLEQHMNDPNLYDATHGDLVWDPDFGWSLDISLTESDGSQSTIRMVYRSVPYPGFYPRPTGLTYQILTGTSAWNSAFRSWLMASAAESLETEFDIIQDLGIVWDPDSGLPVYPAEPNTRSVLSDLFAKGLLPEYFKYFEAADWQLPGGYRFTFEVNGQRGQARTTFFIEGPEGFKSLPIGFNPHSGRFEVPGGHLFDFMPGFINPEVFTPTVPSKFSTSPGSSSNPGFGKINTPGGQGGDSDRPNNRWMIRFIRSLFT